MLVRGIRPHCDSRKRVLLQRDAAARLVVMHVVAAARLVVMLGKFCHITPVLHQLHCLRVLFCINFKVLLLTFKAIRKLAPSYINDLVKIKPLNSRYGLRSNEGILLSHPNFKTLTTLGDRAFVASAPKLWNDLPSDIRMAKSVDTF